MLEQPEYRVEDVGQIRRLLHEHSWMTIVSALPHGPVVSHAPVLLEPADTSGPDIVVVSHLGRDDAALHELGDHEIVLIAQGPNGYVSPTFYAGRPYAPTWNFVVVHLHGRPELLTPEETYAVLDRSVEHYEAARAERWRLDSVAEYAHQIAPYTTGFRLTASRVVAKAKLSQDKPMVDRLGVVRSLESDAVHGNRELAAQMWQLGALDDGALP